MAVGCGSKPGYLGRPTWEVVRCMLDSPGFDHGQIWKHGFGSSLYNTVHRTASSSGMASLKTSSVFRFHVLYGHFCSSPVLRVAGVQPFGQDRLTRIVGRIEVPHQTASSTKHGATNDLVHKGGPMPMILKGRFIRPYG